MKVTVYSTQSYDRDFLQKIAGSDRHEWIFLGVELEPKTVALAQGSRAICVFVNDEVTQPVLEQLRDIGVEMVALRCAGYNHVDLDAARRLGICVARVPAYSPHAIAEHTWALILGLNRKIHRAHNRIREGNFSLDGLLGFDLAGKTLSVIGVGRIGHIVCRIALAFGCEVLAHDIVVDAELEKAGVHFVDLDELWKRSDVISLHCPLTPETHHLIDALALEAMRPGVMIINTSRGGIVDTAALIAGLKSRKVGALGLDVYEEEEHLFFQDLSNEVICDDVFSRLMTFPNVLITGHQAFFTREALGNIAQTTVDNLNEFEKTGRCVNELEQSRL